ncbi:MULTISPECIES: LysR family transcriptional regulator [Vitreoscilla]|uniref:LysR family transcriptional regulator n=1 Tax=Vitreoscilla stercoraria TaxID=61 RepID=A0ABY4ECI5_VITST|nr:MULTISPECIES: LysR family transcriptional regulator [Vitreoscilla]AUZ04025.1 LysR family transcriptional regulator [Vitreoscilla sp. C1]UOO93125.1 LysR family transcriptional regulator [Vitreoscilla stercoraria]
MRWTLDQLQQFVTTVESGSFSEAARRLGKAQSAVSTAIALLEADLGVDLFDRSRRQVRLTPAGEILLLEAQELLSQVQSLDRRAHSLSFGSDAKLALALDEALPYSVSGRLIREIGHYFPDVELTLLNGTATEVAQYVRHGRAQIAFHFIRGSLPSYFDQRHIGSVAQGVFVPKDHPLTQSEVSQRKKELVRYRQLVMHTEDVNEAAYSPKIWRSDSFYSLAEMVADDLGWAILPVHIAEEENYRKPLVQIDCPFLTLPPLMVRMVWFQGWELSQIAHWIQKRFIELLSDV